LHDNLFALAEIATAVAAWQALMLSSLGLIVSSKALRVTEQQEKRRKPRLVPNLLDGYVRHDAHCRVYVFLLSVSNPADSDNAVAALDLRSTYSTKSNFQMTIKIPSHTEFDKAFQCTADNPFAIPVSVHAHQTVPGWAFFRVKQALLDGAIVEGHTIALLDSHGIESQVEPIMIREYGDATETTPC